MNEKPITTPSGIVALENNERYIPATKRPDGTLRKERRVRPGFTPQEDIARYKNPNILEPVVVLKEELAKPKTKAQKKNEKRKAKRQEKNLLNIEAGEESKEKEIDIIQNKIENLSISPFFENDRINNNNNNNNNNDKNNNNNKEQLETICKKIKALEKKTRQIDRIKEKENKGESLTKEEENKLNNLDQVKKELENLQKLKAELE